MFCFVFCLCYKFLEDLYIEIFVREIYRKIQASYSNRSIYQGIYLQMVINVYAIFSPKHLQMDACGRKLKQIHLHQSSLGWRRYELTGLTFVFPRIIRMTWCYYWQIVITCMITQHMYMNTCLYMYIYFLN